MRQHIDVAVLDLPMHRVWLEAVLQDLGPSLEKMRLHRLPWGQAPEPTMALDPEPEPEQEPVADTPLEATRALSVDLATDFFLRSQVQLRRFDALLLPASLSTLGWTRQALACAPRGPLIPIIGVLKGLRSGAILDLLALGMTDFVTTQTGGQSFRARVISAVSRAPKTVGLREPSVGETGARPFAGSLVNPAMTFSGASKSASRVAKTARCSGCYVQISALGWPDQGFGTSKQRLVALFEKQYLQAALKRTNGNITAAASNSLKNRRAFWELLRKHGLVSRTYSDETSGDETSVGAITGVKSGTESETGMHSDISQS